MIHDFTQITLQFCSIYSYAQLQPLIYQDDHMLDKVVEETLFDDYYHQRTQMTCFLLLALKLYPVIP